MANDLLVKLYTLGPKTSLYKKLADAGIQIKRARVPEMHELLQWVDDHFEKNYVQECNAAILEGKLFIAVKNKKPIGFACADAPMRGFFGPIAVLEEERSTGVGGALLNRALMYMKEIGYAYAIIGWVGDALPFYQKTLPGVIVIPDSHPGAYADMCRFDSYLYPFEEN